MMISEYFIRKDDGERRLILRICCDYFKEKFDIHFTVEEILSSSRKTETVFKRALVCLYLVKRKMSYNDIAKVVKKVSHASVMNAIKYRRGQGRDFRWESVSKRITGDPPKSEMMEKIKWHQNQIMKLNQEIKKL
jgi:predicted transcriptional regulator